VLSFLFRILLQSQPLEVKTADTCVTLPLGDHIMHYILIFTVQEGRFGCYPEIKHIVT